MARTCRECGCTDDHACNPPCWWVEADLCSACTSESSGYIVGVLDETDAPIAGWPRVADEVDEVQ